MPLNSSAEISGEFARLKNVIPADESERSALLRAFGMATNAVASNRALATALTMDALIDVMLSASDSALRRRAATGSAIFCTQRAASRSSRTRRSRRTARRSVTRTAP